jgi:phosphomannomutase
MKIDPSIFRDYDIRAVIPDQLDEEGLVRVSEAVIRFLAPNTLQVGRDMRLTSPKFHRAFINTALKQGVDVVDLGLVSTDMLYFASGKYGEDAAVTISASHNPPEYNGMKIVKKGAVAVSGDSGIYKIRDLALSNKKLDLKPKRPGRLSQRDILPEWIKHVLTFIQADKMNPYKVVIDTGNGMAGHFMPALEEKLPWRTTRLYYELDGRFPHHVPSPIEEKNRVDAVNKLFEVKADVSMVFDGDGDMVYMIDEKGRTLSGTIMTAIIAENLLQKHPGETILYNAIIGRVVSEIISRYRGKGHRVRVGHTLIKEDMRKFNGLFCGEHSGHYYFRQNYYADSAIIAALLVMEQMSVQNKKLSQLYDQYDKYPASGEINFNVEDKDAIMKKVEDAYQRKAVSTDRLDGVTVWFQDWWFNVRPSNTEPLLRLNLEAVTQELMEQKRDEVLTLIRPS